MDVKYVDQLPTPNLLDQDRRLHAQQLLLTKASDWAYEREWRVLDPLVGPGLRSFPPELLSALILGTRISEPDRERLIDWVRQRVVPLPVYYAELDANRFGLTFAQIA